MPEGVLNEKLRCRCSKKNYHNFGAEVSSGPSEVLMGPPLEAHARVQWCPAFLPRNFRIWIFRCS